MKRILVLVNAQSGSGNPYQSIRVIEKVWEGNGRNLLFQFSQSPDDGREKVRSALRNGVDAVLVVGGDGMINSIGSELVHQSIPIGVIPAGSGNGFARHFKIPLQPEPAARALLDGKVLPIDAGCVNNRPFFVTCSLAWEGRLVEAFEKFPFRGLVPYIIAGTQQLIEYKPQPFQVEVDGEPFHMQEPLVFTVANLSQFGGGFSVAPDATADSGDLELVAIERRNMPRLLGQVQQLVEKTFHQNTRLVTNRHFKTMRVQREKTTPLQLDGELFNTTAEVQVEVLPGALHALIPKGH